LVLVFTSSHIDRQIVAILAEPIKDAFQISDTQLGLLTGVMFALFYATLGIPMAMWADRGNRRNLIALSVGTWSLMTALCGAAQAFWHLLLARIGVGVGEAGSNPPSHSIIADLYPPMERGTAMAIFGTGVNIGIMLGYLIGGWVNEWLDWRWAFVVAGLPGILIALIVRYTLIEPPRGYSEPDKQVASPPPFAEVARTLWRSLTLRHTIIAGTLAAFAGYATVAWIPAYFMRIHDMSSGDAGTVLALLIGLLGGIGTFLGGWLADRLARRSEGWRAWVVALAAAVYAPFALIAYAADSQLLSVLAFAVPAFTGGVYIGCGFAIVQNQTPVAMRSVAAAINLFIVNIIGLGLGPLTVGAISDLLRGSMGEASLRVGLAAMAAVMLWSGAHYLYVGKRLHMAARS
jgi:predicted MFS family arabinose efflux permease